MSESTPARRYRLRMRPHRAGRPVDPRLSFANERTFLAWNRTALALIGGGLAAAQLLPGLGGARLAIGLPLIALGVAVALAGFTRWHASELAMRLRAPLPRSRLAPALLGLGAGVIALLSIVFLALSQLRQ